MANSRARLERGGARRDEAEGAAGVIGAVDAVEIGHGGVAAFGVGGPPVSEQTDGQATEHAQDPDAVAGAHAAVVFAQRGVEALVQSTLDTPVLTVGLQPLGGIETGGIAAGQQPDRLGTMVADVAVQLGDLGDMREAHLLGAGHAAVQLPALTPAAIAFRGPCLGRRVGLRGKTRPGYRPGALGRFGGCLFGYP